MKFVTSYFNTMFSVNITHCFASAGMQLCYVIFISKQVRYSIAIIRNWNNIAFLSQSDIYVIINNNRNTII